MDPNLAVRDVFARARRPPRVTSGVVADEAAAQIERFRSAAGGPPLD
jgi:hypothetical protein